MPEPEIVGTALFFPDGRGTLLGFDFGLARIGVATGELETRKAHPLETISTEANAARFEHIGRLIAEWQAVGLVVGLPASVDGVEHATARRCRRFANQLHGRFNIPVALIDEGFSSAQAEAEFRSAGRKSWQNRKPVLDAVAAQVILQHFLDVTHNATS